MDLNQRTNRKFIASYDVNDYEIETEDGWKDIQFVHKTVEYDVWKLELENRLSLECADDHIVFLENGEQCFVKDLKKDAEVKTKLGLSKVRKSEKTSRRESMYDVSIGSEQHSYYANGVLSHNSTSYSIFALWYVLSNKDKNILICANKLKTAVEILSRIQLAYQELPNWLKPGIVEWNKTTIAFDNGCKISAEATSGNSGRGLSVNCLICDEFAMLKPGIEADFLQGVFPVVSSSKTSKIIIVSTPKGMGNEFYRIYTRASLDIDNNVADENLKWKPIKIDWWDVPGRDEKWKQQQIETFNGSLQNFNQEYGNCLCGNTKITLKNEETNEILETNLDSLYNYFYLKQNQVLTPFGFKHFDGITVNEKDCIRILFKSGNSVDCSLDHPFYKNGKLIYANELIIGDKLDSKNDPEIIVSIIKIRKATML